MAVVLVHAGASKTGSTTIQRLLAANDSCLQERGIRYARTARSRTTSERRSIDHHRLAHALVDGDERPWRALRREIEASGAEMVVLSAEAFSTFPRRGLVERMLRHLDGFEVHVQLYLRGQRAFARSGYRQMVSSGNYAGSFRQFLEENIVRFDYVTPVDGWYRHLGRSHVDVSCFESVVGGPGLVPHFVSRLHGVSLDELVPPPPQNVTRSDRAIHLERWLTRHAGQISARAPWAAPLVRSGAKAGRALADRDGVLARRFGSRIARREGDLTPEEDLRWLAALPQLREWNDAFRRRWPELADPELLFAGEQERPDVSAVRAQRVRYLPDAGP